MHLSQLLDKIGSAQPIPSSYCCCLQVEPLTHFSCAAVHTHGIQRYSSFQNPTNCFRRSAQQLSRGLWPISLSYPLYIGVYQCIHTDIHLPNLYNNSKIPKKLLSIFKLFQGLFEKDIGPPWPHEVQMRGEEPIQGLQIFLHATKEVK